MLSRFLLIFFILLILSSLPVEATTSVKSYSLGTVADLNLTSDYFWFDNANYISVRNVTITSNVAQVNGRFLKQSDSTAFTIISGGSGTGTFRYVNLSDITGVCSGGNCDYQLTWSFTNAILTTNKIHISYTSRILDSVVAQTGGATSATDVSVNQPVYMVRHTGATNTTIAGNYVVTVDTTAPTTITSWSNSWTNNNSLAFTVPTTANIMFTASANVNIDTWQWFLDGVNQSNNFNSFSQTFTYGFHNVTVSARNNTNGTSDAIIWTINSGGVATAIGSIVPDSDGYGLAFDKSKYNLYETGNILYAIDSSIFNFLSDFNIRVYNQSGGVLREYHNLDSGSGSVQYYWGQTGNYQAKLFKTTFGLDSEVKSNSTIVIEPESYLFINASIPVGKNFQVNYTYGLNPDCTSNLCRIKVTHTRQDGTIYVQNSFDTSNATIAGYSYSTFIYVTEPGNYFFELMYGSRSVANANAVADYAFPITTINIVNSFINTSKTNYNFDEVIYGNYAIAGAYYSNYYGFIEVNNTDQNQITAIYPVAKQTSDFQIEITNIFYTQNQQQNDFLGSEYTNKFFLPGNNDINLKVRNNTANVTLATTKITIGRTNAGGYGLISNKYTGCTGDKFILSITVPTGASSRIEVREGLKVIKNVTINTSMSMPITFTKAGSYNIDLIANGFGFLQSTANINVNNCQASGIPAPQTMEGDRAVSNSGENLKSLMSMPAFWGLMFLIITVVILATKSTTAANNIGLVAFLIVQIEAFAGMFAPYTWYILIISWLIVAVFYVVVGKKVTVAE